MRVLVDPAPIDDETREFLVDAWAAILRAELAARATAASATGSNRERTNEQQDGAADAA